MSIDQALLESVSQSGEPTLRLYRWSEPTLSLGYFQSHANRASHDPSSEIACVRRSTGGGAIVHHHELTYSFCTPSRKGAMGANAEIYQRVHRAVIKSLHELGAHARSYADSCCFLEGSEEQFLCFERRTSEDLICSGYKIVGSAQRRHGAALLQHGSILLHSSEFAPSLPGACELSGQDFSATELGEIFQREIASAFELQFQMRELDATEQGAGDRICEARYGSQRWTERR